MKLTKIRKNIQNDLQTIIIAHPPLISIVNKIHEKGGRALLVGGAVRDLLLGLPIKDLDVEVHNLSLPELEAILRAFGPVSMVGKSFGVLRLHGLEVDWSVPRVDSKGRKPVIAIDPFMGFKKAFSRRDLTMNAIGIDLITHEIIDPYNGVKDLQEGILRFVDKHKFVEDPLRFFRVMQFMGRFGMIPDEKLHRLCKTMDLHGISTERIEAEFEKLMLQSKQPSRGIRWLKDIGRLKEILPEVGNIIDVPQDESWHPEGGVFEHTMQCIDAAAVMNYENDKQKLLVTYAALCHDLGKAITTEFIGGRWKSVGHSKEGVVLSKSLLSRITKKKDLIEAVSKLVRYHMSPAQFIAAGASPAAYKRLAKKLYPLVDMQLLAKVALADKQGRNPIKGVPLKKKFPAIDKFLEKAKKAHVEKIPEPPVLKGRDIIDIVMPGPQMGEMLKMAYEIQIERGIKDKEALKKIILENRQ